MSILDGAIKKSERVVVYVKNYNSVQEQLNQIVDQLKSLKKTLNTIDAEIQSDPDLTTAQKADSKTKIDNKIKEIDKHISNT